MNRSYRIIPCYTGDVSGVASALYELGGMVVMHDPSGCNSTYNTHDETRWYDQDSLIFISGLSQTDAILGNDEKLIDDICDAARDLHPAFIALASCPIPYMNGTDFPAIARLLEQELSIPAFFAPTNGMHDYVVGAGGAFLALGRKLWEEGTLFDFAPSIKPDVQDADTIRMNLLGVTPLDFMTPGQVKKLYDFADENQLSVSSNWAMGDDLETLYHSKEADVNLVVSSVGYPLACYMKEHFGIPFVVGRPEGAFADVLAEELRAAAAGRDYDPCPAKRRDERTDGPLTILIGEPVAMGSLANALASEESTGFVRVICPVEAAADLIGEGDLRAQGEEDIEGELLRFHPQRIVADPLYRPICPMDCEFTERPHLAFSGRCFLNRVLAQEEKQEDMR